MICSLCKKNKEKINFQRKYKEFKTCNECYVKRQNKYQDNKVEIKKKVSKRYIEKRVEIKEYNKNYYTNNRDKIKESNQIWRENNKDKIKQLRIEYNLNNRDKIKETNKNYYSNNKDKIKEVKRVNKSDKCKSCKLFYTKRKSEYLCFYCYKEKYPNNKNYMGKERVITDFIKKNYENYNIYVNKRIGKRRPDILININNQHMIIEIDEHQHYSYKCEEVRVNEIFLDLENLNLTLIRINPDKYNNKQGIFSTENGKLIVDKVEFDKRMSVLKKTIDSNIGNNEVFKEIKLFYD